MGACQSNSASVEVGTTTTTNLPKNNSKHHLGGNTKNNNTNTTRPLLNKATAATVGHSGSTAVTVATTNGGSQPDLTCCCITDEDSHHSSSPERNAHSSPQKIAPCSGTMMKRPSSRVGLDTMVEERRKRGHLVSNVVHIESKSTLRRIQDIYAGVEDGKVLGEGVAGLVRNVVHKATGLPYAVKVLNLDRLLARRQESGSGKKGGGGPRDSSTFVAQQQEALRNEITIMSQLDHPHIARLQEVYEDDDNIYLVQEVCTGGELFDLLDDQPEYCLTEPEALRLVWQMLSALRYLHSKGIVHRDLKLENFLFSTTKHLQLKMIDFGLSKHFQHPGEVQHDLVGTPYTVAPEVIRGNYDEKCDLWAIGVMAYIMLCGEAPFGGCGGPESFVEVRQNILKGEFSFDKPDTSAWASISDDAKDFIRTVLVTDPHQRPSAAEAQQHPWIRNYHGSHFDPKTTMVNPRLVQALLDYKELPITKRLMFEVVSFTLMQDQIAHIQMEFEKLDTDGLGELSLDNMRHVLSRRGLDTSTPSRGEHKKSLSKTLSTPEIESVFNHIKMGKTESRVHWHEFVAACLPTCQVDDRNLRIAFDRLDQDHNGFITFDEVVEMIARDADEDEEALMNAWKDSVEEYGCQQSHFSFEDFCRLIHSYA